MSLISVAVYDLEGSGRTEITEKFFQSLIDTVDFRKHEIYIIDNNSCHATQKVILEFLKVIDDIAYQHATLIHNHENLGTAKAVNQGLRHRKPGQMTLKCDNDVIFHQQNWLEELEEAIRRQPNIGILGLKRKDLGESPNNHSPHFRTELIDLPHNPGEKWMTFEKVTHGVFGTCTMYNHLLLDKIGYLYQPSVYGWDDGLISTRSTLAGFINGFLPHIEIDHIDPGGTFYQTWKETQAGIDSRAAWELDAAYKNGTRSIYEDA